MNTKPKFEFSKLIMVGVMLTYFIALIFIMAVIWQMLKSNNISIGTAITSFCTFVGAPVSVAIGFYSWKAKNENVPKITNSIANQQTYDNSYMPVNENDGI